MSTLWIIRHGQASFGDSNYDKLSELGQTQSRILGKYLRKTGVVFDKVYTGDMSRQTETAMIALAEMDENAKPAETLTDPAFNEYDHRSIITALLPGLMEDEPAMNDILPNIFKDNREFQKMFGKIMDRWVSGQYETPGAESFKEYVGRVEQGLERAAEKGDGSQIGIFTSGGVVSVAMKTALGLSDEEAMRLGWWVKNTAITVLDRRKGRFNLMSFNNLAHLELENGAELLTYR
ncbi:MAG: histidine phosphatase family protein [Desulfobacteraceae bacterium]|jgi:broad specificity phosphatase PhoE